MIVSSDQLIPGVHESFLASRSFPLVYTADSHEVKLPSLVQEYKAVIECKLASHGAILFRGFDIPTPKDFNDVATSFGYAPGEFLGGGGPRVPIIGDVFTSTETPPENIINFHHELAYLPTWPRVLFFYSQLPATSGGETPLCSSNEVYTEVLKQLPDFAKKIESVGIKYKRTLTSLKNASYSNSYQRSWQDIFETDSRETAEQNARACGHEVILWDDSDSMIVVSKSLPGIFVDPRTQKKMFLNAVVLLTPELIGIKRENSPWFASFGDGSEIDPEDARKVLEIMRSVGVSFTWQQGDILMVDNWTTMHSRNSFIPPRKTLVAMYK